MFKSIRHSIWFVFVSLSYVSLSAPAHASDAVWPGGGTLTQIVAGGGEYTIITLVNLENTYAAPYTLSFYDDNGNPLSLATTAGTGPVITGTLPVGGSTIIQTNGSGAPVEGFAVLDTTTATYDYTVAGSAVFGLPLANLVEASCPLDTGLDSIIAFPFDQTTASYGVALANSKGDEPYQYEGAQTANLAISFYDQNGNNFYSTTMQLAYGAHTSFMLNTQFPQTAGHTGMMVISSQDTSAAAVSACGASGCPYWIKTLGLRANLTNTTLTSVTPIVPCYPQQDQEGNVFCTN